MHTDPANADNDLVGAAHLLYLRGNLADAREKLEVHLQQVPGDGAALRLLTEIEQRQVEDTLVREESIASARSLEWVGDHFLLVVAAGVALIAFACYRAIQALCLASELGISTPIHYVVTTLRGREYPNVGPLHNLFMFPALHFIVGCVLLGLARHYHRNASD